MVPLQLSECVDVTDEQLDLLEPHLVPEVYRLDGGPARG